MVSISKLQTVAEEIISANGKMRFVGIIDLKGNIVEGIMKEGKTSLESQKESEHFCQQVAARRKMRQEFNKSLGKVNYVHVEREKVTQLVIYTAKYTIFVTVEPDLSITRKISLISKIKDIVSGI